MTLVSCTDVAVCTAGPGEVGERLGRRARQLGEQIAAGAANDETSSHLFASLGCVQLAVVDAMIDRRLEPRVAGDLCRLVGGLQDELVARVLLCRSRAFERVQEVLIAIGHDASTTDLIERAPAAVCDAGDFDRAAIWLPLGATWSRAAFHVAEAAAGSSELGDGALPGEAPDEVEVPLRSGLWETELIRRRRPVLVESTPVGSTTVNPFGELARTRAYVAAPVAVEGDVIALLLADTVAPGRSLRGSDRDLIKIFADGLGLAYERSALAERMERQRARLTSAFSSVGSVVGELHSAAVCLTRSRTGATVRAAGPAAGRTFAGSNDRLLTRREREILALMAAGATNRQIAARVYVSESTVKSHVKRILRKLPAANRAEAVYRYRCMIESPGEPGSQPAIAASGARR
jgi:DNA-binding CsgD family transcriptional regulator